MNEDLLRAGFFPLAIFIFGTIIGSFVNAEALNFFSKKKKIRSTCTNCEQVLGFWDLIPILSFLGLGGRCRYCKKSFSIRYLLVELLSGLFFMFACLKFGLSINFALIIFTFSASLLAVLIDFKKQILPDKIILPLGIILAVFYILNSYFKLLFIGSGFESPLAGFLVGAGVLGLIFLLTLGRGIGFGDVKFAAILGMILGGYGTLVMIFFAFIIGGAFSAYLLAYKKANRKTAIPFGPFIFAGFIIAIFFSDQILMWYN